MTPIRYRADTISAEPEGCLVLYEDYQRELADCQAKLAQSARVVKAAKNIYKYYMRGQVDVKANQEFYDAIEAFANPPGQVPSGETKAAPQILGQLAEREGRTDTGPQSIEKNGAESGDIPRNLGAAPMLPQYPDVYDLWNGNNRGFFVSQMRYDLLRTAAEKLARGEFICRRCGIRKDGENEPANF